jgi:hypothetical protein
MDPVTPAKIKSNVKVEAENADFVALVEAVLSAQGTKTSASSKSTPGCVKAESRSIWTNSSAAGDVIHPDLVPNCSYRRGIYDHEEFYTKLSTNKTMLEFGRKGMGKTSKENVYTVPIARANKALKILHHSHLEATLRHACGCTHECNTKFSVADLIAKRRWYLSFHNELASRAGLVSDMKQFYDKKQRRHHYRLHRGGFGGQSVPVCSTFYMMSMGIHETKLKGARKAVQLGNTSFVHLNRFKHYETVANKAANIRAFWRDYYDRICQVVKHGEIVLPHGTVLRLIYNRTLLPQLVGKRPVR